jgi:hypothetical protein
VLGFVKEKPARSGAKESLRLAGKDLGEKEHFGI